MRQTTSMIVLLMGNRRQSQIAILKAYCILQMIVLKKWFGCPQKRGAIIHCDKYITFFLFVTKDKQTHKENHLVYLKTMEED